MESRHLLKNVNVSLRKVRTFLPTIKKLSPVLAIERLSFLPHSAAKVLGAGIKTAISNAKSTLKVPENVLEFRILKADQGLVLKRFRAGSRGTALPVNRRMTHITIVLGVKDGNSILKGKEESSKNETKVSDVDKTDKDEKSKVEKKTVKKVKAVRKAKSEKPAVKADDTESKS